MFIVQFSFRICCCYSDLQLGGESQFTSNLACTETVRRGECVRQRRQLTTVRRVHWLTTLMSMIRTAFAQTWRQRTSMSPFCPMWSAGACRISVSDRILSFLARDAMLSAVYTTPIPSVTRSNSIICGVWHACIVSKRLNVSSKFFHHLIGLSF